MMESTPNVVIFDSGVGALSIVDAMVKQQVKGNITVIADSAFYPYGNKSVDVLSARLKKLISTVIQQQSIDIIVLGCNTISTLLLNELRATFDIPIIGVVPAVKPAAQFTMANTFGVLATEVTINGDYLQALIDEFGINKTVKRLACNDLVTLAEKKLMACEKENTTIQASVKNLLDDFIHQHDDIDTLVLACTHFPLLRMEFNNLYPHIHLIDSGQAIANRILFLLEQPRLIESLSVDNTKSQHNSYNHYQFLATDSKYQQSGLSQALTSRSFDQLKELAVE